MRCIVVLSNLLRSLECEICLTSVVHDEVQAESVQEAIYVVMERHGYTFVDSVSVTLSDGVTFSRFRVLGRNTYSVGLWRTKRQGDIPLTADCVNASTPLQAALKLMQSQGLPFVACAVVVCPDGFTWQKRNLRLEKE